MPVGWSFTQIWVKPSGIPQIWVNPQIWAITQNWGNHAQITQNWVLHLFLRVVIYLFKLVDVFVLCIIRRCLFTFYLIVLVRSASYGVSVVRIWYRILAHMVTSYADPKPTSEPILTYYWWDLMEIWWKHYSDVIMGAIASQITSLIIVYSTVYSDADRRKRQSSASLAFVWGIHMGPVNSLHKWPVTRKMFPFDDVIMIWDGNLHDASMAW